MSFEEALRLIRDPFALVECEDAEAVWIANSLCKEANK